MAAPQQQMVVNDPMVMQAQANSRGNAQASVFVYNNLYQGMLPPNGWQNQVQMAERHGKAMTLYVPVACACSVLALPIFSIQHDFSIISGPCTRFPPPTSFVMLTLKVECRICYWQCQGWIGLRPPNSPSISRKGLFWRNPQR